LSCCNSNGLLPCTIATNIGCEREKGTAHYTLYRMRKAECNARCTLYYRMCTREYNTLEFKMRGKCLSIARTRSTS
jgi:hypothetical protein